MQQKQPDWFTESTNTLMPLIQKKNEAHERMLQNHSTKNRKELHRQQRVVKEAVQAAKERRVLQVARGGEKGGKDGHVRCTCIRKLQVAHDRRRPTRPSVVLKEDGVPTAGMDMVKSRRHWHLTKLLNIPVHSKMRLSQTCPRSQHARTLMPHLLWTNLAWHWVR